MGPFPKSQGCFRASMEAVGLWRFRSRISGWYQLLTLRCSGAFYLSLVTQTRVLLLVPSFRAFAGSLWSCSSQEPHKAAPALDCPSLWLLPVATRLGQPFSGSSALATALHPFQNPGSEELGPETPSFLPPMSLCSRTKDKSGELVIF